MNIRDEYLRQKASELGKLVGQSRAHARHDASANVRYKRKENGKLVRLKRVRRKKKKADVSEVRSPSQVFGTDRVTLTGELGKAAPVQTKTSVVGAKKPRRRSITPGLGNIIKKAVRG